MSSARLTGPIASLCLLISLQLCLLFLLAIPNQSYGSENSPPSSSHREETEFILGPAKDNPLKLAHDYLDRRIVSARVDAG